MNPGTLTNFNYILFSSNGDTCVKGNAADNGSFTFKDTVHQQFAQDHSVWNLQPITFHCTHTFQNITALNNRLYFYVEGGGLNGGLGTGYIHVDIVTGQYSAEQLVTELNTRIRVIAGLLNLDASDPDYKFFEIDDFGVLSLKGVAVGSAKVSMVEFNNDKSPSTLWPFLGLSTTSNRDITNGNFEAPGHTVPVAAIANSFPYPVNLRGPETIMLSLDGTSGTNLCISNGVMNVYQEHDDPKLFLVIPVNCEYGGVISHTFEDTYANSIILNDLRGEITNEFKVSLYNHLNQRLYLQPSQTCSILFKQHHCPVQL